MSGYTYARVRDPDTGAVLDACVRRSDGMLVRNDPGNLDWQAYLAWCAGGAVPDVPVGLAIAAPDISDRQFARGLWGDGIIAYADYLGFIGPGTIPPSLQAIGDTLPDDDTGRPTPRKEAVGLLTGERTYRFSAPLVEALRQAMVATDPRWTPDYLRARWRAWATL